MTLKEWEKKWATGVVEGVPGILVGVPKEQENITVQMERHRAPAGEFIREYVKHLNIPWWRRGPYWKLIEKWMREKLDTIGIMEWHWR